MAKGNNFEFGAVSTNDDMTPEEILAARGVCAEPSEEDKSSYIVHGKGGEEKKIPMSKGVTGLEDASGRFPEQGDQVYSPRRVRCKAIGRKAIQRLALSRVKRRLFL